MVTTTGQPEHRQWGSENWHHPTANPWALEAITQRGYTDWDTPAQDLGDDPILTHSQELERDGEAPPRVRSERTEAAARTVIADALGVDVTELDADIDLSGLNDIVSHDLTDTRAALDALDRALADPRRPEAPKAAPGQSDGTYEARQGNWRERHNLPRRKTKPSPSRTPEGRRQAHLRKLVEAGRFTSLAEADRNTQRRQSFGRKKPKRGPNGNRSQSR